MEKRLNHSCDDPSTVLLCGFYGRGNFGDDLMGVSLARFLIEECGFQVVIAASKPDPFRTLFPSNIRIVRPNIAPLLAQIGEVQLLCQGGGSIFHDAYARPYRFRYWIRLLLWGFLFLTARLRRAEVIVLGAGIGPFHSPITRFISKMAFAQCRAIGVRDKASQHSFARLHSSTPLFRGQDIAMLQMDRTGTRPQEKRSGKKVLGISVCSLAPFLREPKREEAYWRSFAEALSTFGEEQDCEYAFFSLFSGEGFTSKDDQTTERILSQLASHVVVHHHVYEDNPGDFLALFGACDWLIAAKYHAAVAGFISGADLAVIAYHRKLRDFADEIGLPPSRIMGIDSPTLVSEWLSLLRDFTHPAEPVPELSPGVAAEQARKCVLQVIGTSHAGRCFDADRS